MHHIYISLIFQTIVHVSLVSKKPEERRDAAKHLGLLRCGDAMVFYALKDRLRVDDDERTRYEAAKSLILLGRQHVQLLILLLFNVQVSLLEHFCLSSFAWSSTLSLSVHLSVCLFLTCVMLWLCRMLGRRCTTADAQVPSNGQHRDTTGPHQKHDRWQECPVHQQGECRHSRGQH